VVKYIGIWYTIIFFKSDTDHIIYCCVLCCVVLCCVVLCCVVLCCVVLCCVVLCCVVWWWPVFGIHCHMFFGT
jgi:hypothetical protein